ncbi:MAG: hypothetical protein NXI31_24655 [bacterium]|nr:hypothetical protein [bacterium]
MPIRCLVVSALSVLVAVPAIRAQEVASAPEAAPDQPPMCHEVAGAPVTVFACAIDHGVDDDAPGESGVARVLARLRLQRARAAVPEAGRSGSLVGADVSILFVSVPQDRWPLGAAFVRALFDDELPLTTDEIALATARVALAVDDAEWLYPGWVLQSRARRALLTGSAQRGLHGDARSVQQVTPARVRELLGRACGVEHAVFGAVPAAVRELRLPGRPPQGAPPRRAVEPAKSVREPSGSAPGSPTIAKHSRVNGPFVAVAARAPGPAEHAAFAVGVEVARARARRRLPNRLFEAHRFARAPLVGWSWLDADAIVVLTRRGHDGDEPEQAFAELDALLADLRERPPSARELEKARRTLAHELAPLPWNSTASVSPGRVVVAMRAARRGITSAAITGVSAAAAHRALASALAPDRLWRGGLVPSVVKDPFRRR